MCHPCGGVYVCRVRALWCFLVVFFGLALLVCGCFFVLLLLWWCCCGGVVPLIIYNYVYNSSLSRPPLKNKNFFLFAPRPGGGGFGGCFGFLFPSSAPAREREEEGEKEERKERRKSERTEWLYYIYVCIYLYEY